MWDTLNVIPERGVPQVSMMSDRSRVQRARLRTVRQHQMETLCMGLDFVLGTKCRFFQSCLLHKEKIPSLDQSRLMECCNSSNSALAHNNGV